MGVRAYLNSWQWDGQHLGSKGSFKPFTSAEHFFKIINTQLVGCPKAETQEVSADFSTKSTDCGDPETEQKWDKGSDMGDNQPLIT